MADQKKNEEVKKFYIHSPHVKRAGEKSDESRLLTDEEMRGCRLQLGDDYGDKNMEARAYCKAQDAKTASIKDAEWQDKVTKANQLGFQAGRDFCQQGLARRTMGYRKFELPDMSDEEIIHQIEYAFAHNPYMPIEVMLKPIIQSALQAYKLKVEKWIEGK